MIVLSDSARKSRTVEIHEPTPEDIRQLTAEIRRNWTARERRRRSGNRVWVELLQMPLQPRRKGFWGENNG